MFNLRLFRARYSWLQSGDAEASARSYYLRVPSVGRPHSFLRDQIKVQKNDKNRKKELHWFSSSGIIYLTGTEHQPKNKGDSQ
jgi:hypothetical protein